MTNTIRIEVSTDSMSAALHELSALMSEAQRSRDTTSSTTDRAMLDRLRGEEVRHEGYTAGHKDGYTNGYRQGLHDAQSEKAQERAMSGNNTLPMMLGHDEVSVCMEPGRAPFPFRPIAMTKFGDVPWGDTPENMIGTPRECVGMYGINLITRRPMFIVRVDHWTLLPRSEPKALDNAPASE